MALVIHTLSISNQQSSNDTNGGNLYYSEKNLCHCPFVTRTGPELIPALCNMRVATDSWSCAVRSDTQQYALNIVAQFGRDIAFVYVALCYILMHAIVHNDVYTAFGNVNL